MQYLVSLIVLILFFVHEPIDFSTDATNNDDTGVFWLTIQRILMMTVCGIASMMYAIPYLLGMNVKLIKIIVNSFDFWFKMYNLLLIIISVGLIQSRTSDYQTGCINSTIFWIFIAICGFLNVMFLCLFDALYLSTKIKLIIISSTSIMFLFNVIGIFLSYNESYY